MFNRSSGLAACVLLLVSAIPAARAQWAVVDAPAIVQLVQEVKTLEQQLQTARDQLTQARQVQQAMTGDRGMEWLVSGTSRNYLPSNWTQINDVLRSGAGGAAAADPAAAAYAGLSSDIRRALGSNAVLSPQQMSMLSPANQQQITAARQSNALQQALAQQALTNVSGRFASLQTLISAIGAAGDPKAVLDLQARIGAELGMLQNEQTKLQILQQSIQAQDAVYRQQEREQVIAGHGRFESRFQPTP